MKVLLCQKREVVYWRMITEIVACIVATGTIQPTIRVALAGKRLTKIFAVAFLIKKYYRH